MRRRRTAREQPGKPPRINPGETTRLESALAGPDPFVVSITYESEPGVFDPADGPDLQPDPAKPPTLMLMGVECDVELGPLERERYWMGDRWGYVDRYPILVIRPRRKKV